MPGEPNPLDVIYKNICNNHMNPNHEEFMKVLTYKLKFPRSAITNSQLIENSILKVLFTTHHQHLRMASDVTGNARWQVVVGFNDKMSSESNTHLLKYRQKNWLKSLM